MASLKLVNINKIYPNGAHAVHDFNLDIKDGEFIVMVGPSGCGKSTTLRMIAGLESISSGDLILDGERVNKLAPVDRDVAMVFQNYALYYNMSVYDNIGISLKIKHEQKNTIHNSLLETSKKFDLVDYLNRLPANLSGGQRQRVALCRTVVRNPRVFLMDEPLSNLDAKLREKTRSEIVSLQRELKTTTIYVTHDQIEAMTMADRIVIMNNGYIMQVGTPTELYDKPDNLFVAGFIGTPNMNFIKCIVDGTSLHIKDEIIPIAVSHQEILKPYDGKEVILGIRPEHIDMSEEIYNLHKAALTLPIDYYEYLGKEYYVKLRLYDDIITARLDSRYDVSKEKITVYFDMDRVCYFDPQTEQRIGRLKEDGKENI